VSALEDYDKAGGLPELDSICRNWWLYVGTGGFMPELAVLQYVKN
jgi:hypothetical protein